MYIKTFQQISINDLSTAGGKGASLGEMTQAGLPVPEGFVITTYAFKEFNNKSFSDVFKKEIFSAFENLNADRVAVRSSAVAEDSKNYSWAGQLDTYLNVSRDELLDSIKKCWDSIKSNRASEYIKQNKIPSNELSVAVVIQQMIESEISGVMFTANPVTENRNKLMIESAYGLGEYIVQGIITPDNYIVDKSNLEIKSKDLGNKEKMNTFKEGRNKELDVTPGLQEQFSLNDNQIKELAALGIKIENHYGFPCDIEWAYKNDKFYITQSRPITTFS